MLVGGRYQITQLCCNCHGSLSDGVVCSSLDEVVGGLEYVDSVFVFSFFSIAEDGVATEVAVVGKSNAVPGVLGVCFADPNPNAPDPRPKALDAPAPVRGEDIPVVARGATLLKGLERPPCELLPRSYDLVG